MSDARETLEEMMRTWVPAEYHERVKNALDEISQTVVTFDENRNVLSRQEPYRGGTVTGGTWSTVARDLVEIGWGTLNQSEYCKQLVVDRHGINMVIGRRGKS